MRMPSAARPRCLCRSRRRSPARVVDHAGAVGTARRSHRPPRARLVVARQVVAGDLRWLERNDASLLDSAQRQLGIDRCERGTRARRAYRRSPRVVRSRRPPIRAPQRPPARTAGRPPRGGRRTAHRPGRQGHPRAITQGQSASAGGLEPHDQLVARPQERSEDRVDRLRRRRRSRRRPSASRAERAALTQNAASAVSRSGSSGTAPPAQSVEDTGDSGLHRTTARHLGRAVLRVLFHRVQRAPAVLGIRRFLALHHLEDRIERHETGLG